MRSFIIAAFAAATTVLAAPSWAGTDVTLEQLPAPVRATVDRETKGGQITDIERDREAGKVIFEVEFRLDGKEYELDIAEDGTLLERRLD